MAELNRNPLAVIKVGGDTLLDPKDRLGLAQNISDLLAVGWHCVLLHGGGPQLNRLQELHGLAPIKIDGRRLTGEADLLVVKQALCGEVNVDLVSALIASGVSAFGCHGASGLLIQATKRPPIDLGVKGVLDFGEVGDVVNVNAPLLRSMLEASVVPVIASLGVSCDGRIFNINADTTVAAIAAAMKADLLILSTKIGGIFEDITKPESRLSVVTPQIAEQLIGRGVITDGMIPKVRESLMLLEQGVGSIVIANASQAGGFLSIASNSKNIGTRLSHS